MTIPRWLHLFVLATAVVNSVGSSIAEATVGRNNVDVQVQECTAEGSCDDATVTGTMDDGSSCVNTHEKCDLWASQGKCEQATKYMEMYCQKSCGICGAGSNSTE